MVYQHVGAKMKIESEDRISRQALFCHIRRGKSAGATLVAILATIVCCCVFALAMWLTNLVPSWDWNDGRYYNRQETGVDFAAKRIFAYEAPRSFNGDGYSAIVYKLDEKTAQSFYSPMPEFFSSYPIANARVGWTIEHWKESPLREAEKEYLEYALAGSSGMSEESKEGLLRMDSYIREVLSSDGAYYAYVYSGYERSSDGRATIENIDFYILIPKDKKYIVINSNS